MSRILVGGISPEGEHILNTYRKRFFPDAEIIPLKSVGLKHTMSNVAILSDTILVILDEGLWASCQNTSSKAIQAVLNDSKTHKYMNDDGLTQFLISNFGKLDASATDMGKVEESEPIQNYHTVGDEEPMLTLGDYEQSDDSDRALREAKITELKDKLAQSEMLVKNLTAQLEDSKNATDIQAFIDRIRDLENQLVEKDTELQQHESNSFENSDKLEKAEKAIQEVETLKTEIKQLKEDSADTEYKYKKVIEEKESLQTEYDTLKSEVEELRSTKDNFEEVTASLAEMTERCAALESANSDASILQTKLEEQNNLLKEYDSVKDSLSQKELDMQNLQVDLDTKIKKVEELTVKLNDFSSLIDEKEEELKNKQTEIDNLVEEKKQADAQIETLYAQLTELKSNLAELHITLEKKAVEIENLEKERDEAKDNLTKLQEDFEQLDGKTSEIGELQSALNDAHKTLESLQNTINELNTTVGTQEGTIAAYEQRIEMINADKETSNEALNKALEDNNSLNTQLNEKQEELNSLESQVNTLKAQLNDAQNSNSDALIEKDNTILELQSNNSKLENEVTKLRNDLVDANADSETITQLNNDLLDERRKNARISAELEVLKKGNGVLSTSDTIVELNKLRQENKELRKELEQRPDVVITDVPEENNSTQVIELRQRVADLEVELADATNTLEEYQEGMFGKLANVALPKIAYDVKVIVPAKLESKCVVIASGSIESTYTMYQNLKRACVTTNNKSYLIVDLVTDTCIDMAFGIKNTIVSPIKWLTGEQPYKMALTDTPYANVKVLTTGLAYLNDLSLLNVDWVSRINELQNQFDVVIFNVGCLNSFISKILFCSFAKIMPGHIVLKATPINLRTMILTLTGITDKNVLSNTIVSCVEYDSKSINTKNLYKKLSEKCQSQMLKDENILRF